MPKYRVFIFIFFNIIICRDFLKSNKVKTKIDSENFWINFNKKSRELELINQILIFIGRLTQLAEIQCIKNPKI